MLRAYIQEHYDNGETSIIEKVMPKVKPDTNAAEILTYLRER